MSREQQRDELPRTIRSIVGGLYGSADGWDFKPYVLGMRFYRYIPENLAAYINQQEREAGTHDFDDNALSYAAAEFVRDGNQKKLSPANRQTIVNATIARQNIGHFARHAPNADLEGVA